MYVSTKNDVEFQEGVAAIFVFQGSFCGMSCPQKQILECNKHVSGGNYPTWLSGSFLYNDWAWEMRISHLIGLDLGFWGEVFSAFFGDQVHHDL